MKSPKAIILLLVFGLIVLQSKSQNIETIEIRPGPDNGCDAEVRTDMNYPIWYDDDFISNAWTAGGSSFIQRSLIKFDLSLIPAGSVITGAKLSLFCNTSSGHQQLHSGFNSSYLLMITSEWDQYQVVWGNQPSTTMDDAVILPQSQYQTQDYPDIDVTGQIDYFFRNPGLNFGFMLQLVEEEQYRALVFASSNHLNPEKRPLLVVEYIPCQNPDSSFNYSMTGDQNEVSFTLIPDNNTSYWWDFGNGFYSDIPQPVFTFQQTGICNVCLTVSNACGTLVNCDSVIVCDLLKSDFNYEIQGNSVAFIPIFPVEGAQYLWEFGDGFFSNLPDPTHYFNSLDKYRVCLTITNECSSIQYCDTVNLAITGMGNQGSDGFVKLFPNPTTGIVNIEKADTPICINNIKVLAIDGSFVFFKEVKSAFNNTTAIKCDLSDLQNGVYTVLLDSDKGAIYRKIVILH